MVEPSHIHFSSLEQMVLSSTSAKRMLMACGMGGLVGLEREWRHKDSGLRTNMLICMGACLFTIMSVVLAGEGSPNKGQVASNIVQGIGFLGAGLILHTKNRVLGLTSAATVFVVAAIGMTCGAGLYVVALVATVLLLVALQAVGGVEAQLGWKRYPMIYEVRADVGAKLAKEIVGTERAETLAMDVDSARHRMLSAILSVLDGAGQRLSVLDRDNVAGLERTSFTVTATRKTHTRILHELRESDATDQVVVFRDTEEGVSLIPFVKAHACGNDFLIIEDALAQGKHAAMARRLCARNTGVGADGIEFLDRRADGTLFLRLFNADGSEAELSGNGTRCVAAWLAENEDCESVSFATHGGIRTCRVVTGERGQPWFIESGMGLPRVMQCAIKVAGVDQAVEGAMVNVGNPHYVLFVDTDDFSSHGRPWQDLGAKIATDPLFKFGTNVEFVRVRSQGEIEFRIYERGCGPTTSSGTGTCASAAASMKLRGVAREVNAIAQCGMQHVVWTSDDSEMRLTGPAEIICTGEASFD